MFFLTSFASVVSRLQQQHSRQMFDVSTFLSFSVAFAVANSSSVVHLAGTDHKFLPDFSWNKTDDGVEVTEEDMELVNSYWKKSTTRMKSFLYYRLRKKNDITD